MNLYHPVQIGSYTSRGNLFLAPVAGYSDAAYRSICIDAGCDLAYTEMVSSEAITRDSAKTEALLQRAENETEFAVQLFGSNPDTMARAAVLVQKGWNPSIIDINCGCPVPKVIKTGAGSALMRDKVRLAAIVGAMHEAVSTPITVKIRLGWDDSAINYLDVAAAAVEAGAAALTLHARTREQGYSGRADRKAFYALAAVLPVPVFASGDLFSPEDARDILSGNAENSQPVAGVMFARGIMGDPFLFTKTRARLRGEDLPPMDSALRLETAHRHFLLSLRFYNEHTACVEFRKHACAYLKGIQHGAELRNLVVHCSNPPQYENFFATWKSWLETPPGN